MAHSLLIVVALIYSLGVLSSGSAWAYRMIETHPPMPPKLLTTVVVTSIMPAATEIKSEASLATIDEVEGVMGSEIEAPEEAPVLQTQVQ